MKAANPWTLGILFLSCFCYFAWNNFETPSIFLGRSDVTQAVVVDYSFGNGHLKNQVQIATLAFLVNDSTYFYRTRLDGKQALKNIGSKVQVEYSISNPSNYRIDRYFKSSSEKNILKFSRFDEGVNTVHQLSNGIFGTKTFSLKGDELTSKYQRFKIKGDTLQTFPLFQTRKDSLILESYLLLKYSEDNVSLIEINTGIDYSQE